MPTHTTLSSLFTDIANAIRTKDGSSGTIVADNFPARINAIPTGITPTGTRNITQNGTYDVTEFASAAVNVPSSGGLPDPIVAGNQPVLACYSNSYFQYNGSLKFVEGMSFVIPKTGTYRFRTFGECEDARNTYTLAIYKNGTSVYSKSRSGTDTYSLNVETDIACTAGDEIKLYAKARSSDYYIGVYCMTASIDWNLFN